MISFGTAILPMLRSHRHGQRDHVAAVHTRVRVTVFEQLRKQGAGALVGVAQLESAVEASLALAGEDFEQHDQRDDQCEQPRVGRRSASARSRVSGGWMTSTSIRAGASSHD
jgi:hypothetical protein